MNTQSETATNEFSSTKMGRSNIWNFGTTLRNIWIGITLVKEYGILRWRNLWLNYFSTGLLIKQNKKCYISYYDGVTKYTVVFEPKRGPCQFCQVLNDENEDVTNKIREYAGPSHNFHNVKTSPSLLGYISLTFYMRNGEVKIFRENEIISI